jgi:nucleotide-binding universal stress UspA family protein
VQRLDPGKEFIMSKSAHLTPGAVVVGVGDPDEQQLELEWAAREAQASHRPLLLVRAYHLSQATVPWDNSFDRVLTAELREVAERRLAAARAIVERLAPDLEIEVAAVDGLPVKVLRDASLDAAVVVLGSRRLGAVGATVLGSVSTAVAGSAAGPVVIVGSPPGDPRESPQVVVGVDGSPGTDEVLEFAFAYASRRGRDLRAVLCWRPDLLSSMQWRGRPAPPERADRWLAETVAGWQEKYPDVTVHQAVLRDHPVAGLVAESIAQELLVVGAHSHHPRIASALGSVSQGVLHHASCPVAVIHSLSDTAPAGERESAAKGTPS